MDDRIVSKNGVPAVVYFVKRPDGLRSLGSRARLVIRLIRRGRKSLWFPLVCLQLQTAMSRSVFTHVYIAQGDWVLDPRPLGNVMHAAATFDAEHSANIVKIVEVMPIGSIGLRRVRSAQTKSVGLTLLRWATFGLVQSNDCVSLVCDCLRCGGVMVPRTTVTPDHLCRWLVNQGYRHADT